MTVQEPQMVEGFWTLNEGKECGHRKKVQRHGDSNGS